MKPGKMKQARTGKKFTTTPIKADICFTLDWIVPPSREPSFMCTRTESGARHVVHMGKRSYQLLCRQVHILRLHFTQWYMRMLDTPPERYFFRLLALTRYQGVVLGRQVLPNRHSDQVIVCIPLSLHDRSLNRTLQNSITINNINASFFTFM